MSGIYYKLSDLYKKLPKGGNFFIISLEKINAYGKSGRVFTYFENYYEFCEWYLNLDEDMRVVYEVIRGEKPQKPYFDIDIPSSEMDFAESEELISTLLKNISNRIGCDSKDILIFESHGTRKISYHILVSNYYVSSYLHNKQLFTEIVSDFPEKWLKYIDCLYSSTQQFRVVGSHKSSDPSRIKNIKNINKYKDLSQRDLLILTLVTTTEDCEIINISIQEKNFKKLPTRKDSFCDYQLQEIIRDKLEDNYELETMEDGNFHLRRVNVGLICPICDRIHEAENAYLVITEDGDVLFGCFRDSGKHKLIGWIDIEDNEKLGKEAKSLRNDTISNVLKPTEDEIEIPELEDETNNHTRKISSRDVSSAFIESLKSGHTNKNTKILLRGAGLGLLMNKKI